MCFVRCVQRNIPTAHMPQIQLHIYITSAVWYVQDLINLLSESGHCMKGR
jgi:hypothetical protein